MDESTGAACLLIAVLHRALLDARRGDELAESWLKHSGPGLLEWFDIAPRTSRERIELALKRRTRGTLRTSNAPAQKRAG